MPPSSEQIYGDMDRGRKPQFRADCEKQRLECNNPKTEAQIETLITQAYATPEDFCMRLIDIYQLGPRRGKQMGRMGAARVEES
jgi:hypothetical protein